ncbi:MAG TPA: NAD-dependent epimerase/dehydratase family protein [Gaiellaceae bacterium]|jgi:UDP-glucose 4-epimerase
MRTLVTGGAGFVGSHIVDALLARGDEVHVLDNLSTGSRDNLSGGAELHELDVRDPAVETLGAELHPDVVFHLAAQADVGTSVERPAFDAETNVVGTVRVLEAARTAGARVVFTSTGGVIYGECDEPATEDHARLPIAPYAISKLAGEEYVAGWNRLHGTRHVILRLANVYGLRQLPKQEGGVVSIFLNRLARGETVEIFGDGNQERDFVHVSDIAAAFLRAAEDGEGVYNVGTAVATSIVDLYRLCAAAAGVDRDPTFCPARLGELRRTVIDPSRAERELDWRPTTSLADGLAGMWAALQPE